ncbi:hypothetical protein [Asticcacaulis benevestitus]|uniref:Uncharacterized protein n=1 Tax=Asticcacaulis benevestitus DSM 16100 = ATCC BAA-896 TaxID=1121022 RepID=V4PQI3_9CAUL|nr:hypothetical protein [Asticcacaulis benevestitus]ESQ87775.1 hypothetical protein ABENE_17030 [Asticcacaulis benevestitus DSM 16100 = ATCC BAA-896]
MLHTLWVGFGYVLVVTFGGLALWRGGWAERSAATLVLGAWFLTPHLQRGFGPGLYLTSLDCAVTLSLFVISYYSRRIWTLLITSCHLGGTLTHLAAIMALQSQSYAYITTLGLLGGIGVALSLGVGVLENEFIRRHLPPKASSE